MSGNTDLINAAKNGDVERVKQLLKEGADFNVGDQQGLTVLQVAVEQGKVEIVCELLEHAAAIQQRMHGCDVALDFAVQKNHLDIQLCLMSHLEWWIPCSKASGEIDYGQLSGIRYIRREYKVSYKVALLVENFDAVPLIDLPQDSSSFLSLFPSDIISLITPFLCKSAAVTLLNSRNNIQPWLAEAKLVRLKEDIFKNLESVPALSWKELFTHIVKEICCLSSIDYSMILSGLKASLLSRIS